MNPSSKLVLAIALALLATDTAPALAAWPNQPSVNLPVCTAAGSQASPTIVSDGAGGAIVTWNDARGGGSYIYAQHVLPSGAADPAWPVNGRAVCVFASAKSGPLVVSDGTGGAIVTWMDTRGGSAWHVYAQHVLASGIVDSAWPPDGRPLCTAANGQYSPAIAGDGAGGAFVTWYDYRSGTNNDIYVQHVLASGALDPTGLPDGRPLCTAAGDQLAPTIVGDGAGGAFVSWYDIRSSTSYDIYAQHVLASGAADPAWPPDGRALCVAANNQYYPTVVGDGAGGAIVAWQDARAGSMDIYAQHVLASGAVDTTWPLDGRALCTAASSQYSPTIVSDGAGGAIVSWYDLRSSTTYDVYAQHVLASGAVDPAWPLDGRALCTAIGDQTYPVIVGDGAGGAIVTWQDARSGNSDIYAQHVLASGAVDPAWPLDGRALCTAAGYQTYAAISSDGAGGAIVSWQDGRAGNADVYAQRVARYGYLGTPEAEMAGVKDIPLDNGGQVRVSWSASYLEFDPYLAYTYYNLFRSAPTHVAARALARGARLRPATDAALQPGDFVSTPTGTTTLYWELVGQVYGLMVPGYSYVTPTTSDSMGAGNPKTLFMVQTRVGTQVWNSPPDSGYSVDNIPPVVPAPFAANYAAGTAFLHWNRNPDADLAGYRLYRGVGAFSPAPATLIASLPDTGYADAASATYTYKLTAIDVHGNESPAATITPAAITGVGGGANLPRELALAPASPNPAARRTTLRFALPASAIVSLGVYDAAGRLVRVLAAGAVPAGEHTSAWDLRNTGGRIVGAGLYFARLEVGGRTLTRRIAVTQ